MSEGPIKSWRDSWKPPAVTTSPTTSMHAHGEYSAGPAYCGRRVAMQAKTSTFSDVSCSDCLAALRADGRVAPEPSGSDR